VDVPKSLPDSITSADEKEREVDNIFDKR